MLAAHAREIPDGKSTGVGTRFVRIVSEILYGGLQFEIRVEIELVVVRAVDTRDLAEIGALIKTAPGEGDGECFQPSRSFRSGVVKNRGRIYAARGPNPERDIGDH